MTSTQHANIIETEFKTAKDLDLALEKLSSRAPDVLRNVAGLQSVNFVRTAEDRLTHIAVYSSQEEAEAGRETLLPVFEETVREHAVCHPVARQGPVVIGR